MIYRYLLKGHNNWARKLVVDRKTKGIFQWLLCQKKVLLCLDTRYLLKHLLTHQIWQQLVLFAYWIWRKISLVIHALKQSEKKIWNIFFGIKNQASVLYTHTSGNPIYILFNYLNNLFTHFNKNSLMFIMFLLKVLVWQFHAQEWSIVKQIPFRVFLPGQQSINL